MPEQCLELKVTNLCLDFDGRRERFAPVLEEFLQVHQGRLELSGAESLIDAYLDRVWPTGVPGSLIAARSTRKGWPLWLIRPDSDGPLAVSYGADGLVPVFAAYRKTGRLVIGSCHICAQVAPRPFEAHVTGVIRRAVADEYIAPVDWSVLENLPGPEGAEKALAEWRAFLDWRENLIQLAQVAVPYERFEHEHEGQCHFALKGTHSLKQLRRGLSRAEVMVAEVEASRSQDRWTPDSGAGQRPRKLGQVYRVMPVQAGDNDAATSARTSSAHVRPDDKVRVKVIVSVGRDAPAVPAKGFLISNIGGQLKPLQGERKAIERLLNNESQNPYLVHWLFDGRNIAEPSDAPATALPEDAASGLNQEQQAALSKILAAKDAGLLWGPPGTGKTEVLARAARLAIMKGRRVLICSQTHMAVDNAFSRLSSDPRVRPLRIGLPDRVEEESHRFLEEHAPAQWLTSIHHTCQKTYQSRDTLHSAINGATEALERLRQTVRTHADQMETAERLGEARAALTREIDSKQTALSAIGEREALLRSRMQALADLREWLEHPAQTPPASDVLEGSQASSHFIASVTQQQKVLPKLPWDLPHSASQAVTLADGLRWVHNIVTVGRACAALVPLAREALTLCESSIVCAQNYDIESFRQLETEKLQLIDSDRDEDLARVAEINREIRRLRQDRWSTLCRNLLTRLRGVFGRPLPEDLDGLCASLHPESIWVSTLEQLQSFAQQLQATHDAVRSQVLTGLYEKLNAEFHLIEAEGESTRQAKQSSEDTHAEKQHELQEIENRLAQCEMRLRECQNQWDELWPRTCADLNSPEGAPPIDSAALKARASRFQSWLDQHEPVHAVQRRLQPILAEWLRRTADPEEANVPPLRAAYIRHANVIGATCHEAGQRRFHADPEFKPFDLVIADETSKATPVELLQPMLLGRTVVLVGDHRQLHPMFQENETTYEEAIEAGLVHLEDFDRFRSLISAGMFEQLFRTAPNTVKQGLLDQYRMHPQIMKADNVFYGGRLRPGPSEAELIRLRDHGLQVKDLRGGRFIEPRHHLLWLDSSRDQTGRPRFESQRGTSKINPFEADLVLASLHLLNHGLLQQGYVGNRHACADAAMAGKSVRECVHQLLPGAPERTLRDLFHRGLVRLNGRIARPDDRVNAGDSLSVDARKDVGVITFYGAQVREIRQRIASARGENPDSLQAVDLRCNTVDRFQGMERSIVLVSLVRSLPRLRGGDYVRQYQRVNVALSRARELLLIVGAQRSFGHLEVELPAIDEGKPQRVAAYRKIFDFAAEFGGRRYADQVLARQVDPGTR